jgi:cytochrome c-type biogenesis protein
MIQSLFESLNSAMSASMGLALLAAFTWGVLSILLSPCHLASIPLIVGFMSGQDRLTRGRAFSLAGVFSGGILATIAALGAATTAAGRIAGDLGPWANYAVAAVFVIVGLYLLDVLPMPWPGPSGLGIRGRGLLAALVLGLVFGIAVGPCTFAYMAPVLGVTFRVAAARPAYAASLLLLYGVGHCAVIVTAGTAGGAVQRYLEWNQRRGALAWLRRGCGVLVILGGLYLVYAAP